MTSDSDRGIQTDRRVSQSSSANNATSIKTGDRHDISSPLPKVIRGEISRSSITELGHQFLVEKIPFSDYLISARYSNLTCLKEGLGFKNVGPQSVNTPMMFDADGEA